MKKCESKHLIFSSFGIETGRVNTFHVIITHNRKGKFDETVSRPNGFTF